MQESVFQDGKSLTSNGQKDSFGFSLLQSSPIGSQSSVRKISTIDNIVDWNIVRRKYSVLFGGELVNPPQANQLMVVD